MGLVFDPNSHDRLVQVLAKEDFPARYQDLCRNFLAYDPGGAPFNMKEAKRLFREHCAEVTADKRFKMIFFGKEEVVGWRWEASLRVMNYNSLEPMMRGELLDGTRSVGSTWLNIAEQAGAYLTPPLTWQDFSKPILQYNRPCFDGRPETLERLIPELVSLFRLVKQAVREHWETTAGAVQSGS